MPERNTGDVVIQFHSSCYALSEDGEWLASRSGRFITKERAYDTHWAGGWASLIDGFDVAEKKLPPRNIIGIALLTELR